MIRETLNVRLPIPGCACDIHARYDASGVAWLGVYDRQHAQWHTTTDRHGLTPSLLTAALAALEARS